MDLEQDLLDAPGDPMSPRSHKHMMKEIEFPPPLWPAFRLNMRRFFFPKENALLQFEESFAHREHRAPFPHEYPRFRVKNWFDKMILVLVFFNTIVIMADDDIAWLNVVDFCVTCLFVIEVLIRLLCFGFFSQLPSWCLATPGYFRKSWNISDFIIVLLGLLEYLYKSDRGLGLIVLRGLRALRPLRTINRFPRIKLLVNAIIASLPRLRDVSVLYFMFLLCFSSIGVQQYKGLLRFHCVKVFENGTVDTSVPYQSDVCKSITIDQYPSFWIPGFKMCDWGWECREIHGFSANPRRGYSSFDNIGLAFLTIFAIVSTDDWTHHMYNVMNATNAVHSIYFIVVIVVGTFFLMSLTIVLVTFSFEQEHNQFQIAHQTLDNNEESSLQKMINEIKAIIKKKRLSPGAYWQRLLRKNVTKAKWFEGFMTVCIVANFVILACNHYNAPPSFVKFLEYSNFFFIAVFTLELVLMIAGFGSPLWILDSKFNLIDFLIVVLSWVDILLSEDLFVNLTVLRAARVLRILKLIKSRPNIRRWLRIVYKGLSASCVLLAFVCVYMLMFTCFTKELIRDKMFDERGAPMRANFKTIFRGFLTSLQIITGDDWTQLMYAAMSYSGDWVSIIFCLYFYIGNCLLLNLFIGILMHSIESVNDAPGHNAVVGAPSSEIEPEVEMEEIKSAKVHQRAVSKVNSVHAGPRLGTFGRAKSETLLEIDVKEGSPGTQNKEDKCKLRDDKLTADLKHPNSGAKYSLCIFDHLNPVRRLCRYIVIHHEKAFGRFVTLAIAANSVSLALDEPRLAPNQTLSTVLRRLDVGLTICFVTESLMQSIAFGLSQHEQSYLRQSLWNFFDFCLMILSVVTAAMQQQSGSLRLLMIIRVLRPLRLLRRSMGLRVVLRSFFLSLKSLTGILFFIFGVCLVYAITGVQLYGGRFMLCHQNREGIHSRAECEALNYTWMPSPANFDNVPMAMQTLFQLSTLDKWVEVLYQGIDAGDHDRHIRNNHPFLSMYILSFIFLGGLFLTNLFVSTLIDAYDTTKGQERKLLSSEQAAWIEAHKRLVKAAPVKEDSVKLIYFTYFVNFCVLLNLLIMCLEFYPASSTYHSTLSVIDAVFVGVYILEVIVKVYFLGVRSYLASKWNRFDLATTVINTFSLTLEYFADQDGPGGGISGVRAVRIFRFFRTVRGLESVQLLLQTMLLSLPALWNTTSMLGFIFFVLAVLGMNMFGTIHRDQYSYALSRNANFDNFQNSFLLLIRILTTDDWVGLLNDCRFVLECTSPEQTNCCDRSFQSCGYEWPSILYFNSVIGFCAYMFLNLFIAVIMESFETVVTMNVPIHQQHVQAFYQIWKAYESKDLPMHIHVTQLFPLLKALGRCTPLGFPPHCDTWLQQMRFIRRMEAPIDINGHIRLDHLLGKIVCSTLQYNNRGAVISHSVSKVMKGKEKKMIQRIEECFAQNASKSRESEFGVTEVMAACKIQYWYKNWRKRLPPRAPTNRSLTKKRSFFTNPPLQTETRELCSPLSGEVIQTFIDDDDIIIDDDDIITVGVGLPKVAPPLQTETRELKATSKTGTPISGEVIQTFIDDDDIITVRIGLPEKPLKPPFPRVSNSNQKPIRREDLL